MLYLVLGMSSTILSAIGDGSGPGGCKRVAGGALMLGGALVAGGVLVWGGAGRFRLIALTIGRGLSIGGTRLTIDPRVIWTCSKNMCPVIFP